MTDEIDVEATDSEASYLDEEVELRLRGTRRGLLCILGAIRVGADSLERHPRPTATTMAVAADSAAERIGDEFGGRETLEAHVADRNHRLSEEDVRDDVQAELVEDLAGEGVTPVTDGGVDTTHPPGMDGRGLVSWLECLAMQSLHLAGWTDGELEMTFQRNTETVTSHCRGNCWHCQPPLNDGGEGVITGEFTEGVIDGGLSLREAARRDEVYVCWSCGVTFHSEYDLQRHDCISDDDPDDDVVDAPIRIHQSVEGSLFVSFDGYDQQIPPDGIKTVEAALCDATTEAEREALRDLLPTEDERDLDDVAPQIGQLHVTATEVLGFTLDVESVLDEDAVQRAQDDLRRTATIQEPQQDDEDGILIADGGRSANVFGEAASCIPDADSVLEDVTTGEMGEGVPDGYDAAAECNCEHLPAGVVCVDCRTVRDPGGDRHV